MKNKTLYLFILLIIQCSLSCKKEEDIKISFSNDYSDNLVFVIAGQSNAVGYSTGAPDETYLNEIIPSTFIWTGDEWEPLKYGENNEGNSGHGIELNLGYLAQQKIKGNVFIIKLAKEGTALGDSIETTDDWSKTGVLFPELVTKFNNAIENLQRNNICYSFKGFWWDQGERDAKYADLAKKYETNLDSFEIRIRSQLIDGENLENFVTIRLSNTIECLRSYVSTVIAAEETKTYIDSDDLDLQSDSLHLTSKSQNILAERFFNLVFHIK